MLAAELPMLQLRTDPFVGNQILPGAFACELGCATVADRSLLLARMVSASVAELICRLYDCHSTVEITVSALLNSPGT
jgi:hypothetical protein